jgi:arabinofuranosyltransferase
VILNTVHGFGPNFNLGERVQVYTHPLWFLLLTIAEFFAGNIFAVGITLAIVVSLLALGILLCRLARNWQMGLFSAGVLLCSRSFIDYSTSGLENPLSHLFIVLSVYFGRRAAEDKGYSALRNLILCGSALYLCRPDLILLAAPLIAYIGVTRHTSWLGTARQIAIGALPILAWTGFSLFYYGSPFPNTAAAKLGAGVPLSDRIPQGIVYFLHSLIHDPVTLLCAALSLYLAWSSRGLLLSIAAGIPIYFAYLLWIGGDFMCGRMFSAPLVAAVCVISTFDLSPRKSLAALAVALLLSLTTAAPPFLSGPNFSDRDITLDGVADERGFYYQQTGLFAPGRPPMKNPDWSIRNPQFEMACGGVGGLGLQSGPGTYVIDSCALANPLLARLPALQKPKPRVGHMVRQLPTGYIESLRTNGNLLTDPATHTLYETIRRVTTGPLLDPARLTAILNLNLGLIPKPDAALYTEPGLAPNIKPPSVPIRQLQDRTVVDGPRDAPGNILFDASLEILLDQPVRVAQIDMSAEWNDRLRIEGLVRGKYQEIDSVGQLTQEKLTMVRHILDVDSRFPPIERFRIVAVFGDLKCSVGHFRIRTR